MTIMTLKKSLGSLGIKDKTIRKAVFNLRKISLEFALRENGLRPMVEKLREIEPDIAEQESSEDTSDHPYAELKRRSLQAFQCSLMFKALEDLSENKLTVVDIGDSSGRHMTYLKELAKPQFDIDTVSVNLDPRSIEKIKARGLEAILCRAEDLDLGDRQIDLFTSFQMVEHLHNPAIFFRRLAKKSKGKKNDHNCSLSEAKPCWAA